MTFKTFSAENGVTFGEWEDPHGSYLVVSDEHYEHCRLTLSIDKEGLCSVGIDAEWSDDKPGELANFTPAYEHAGNYCQLDEIQVSDGGLLSVMARQRSTAYLQMHMGFTVQLPIAFVAPLREALALLRKRARVTA